MIINGHCGYHFIRKFIYGLRMKQHYRPSTVNSSLTGLWIILYWQSLYRYDLVCSKVKHG